MSALNFSSDYSPVILSPEPRNPSSDHWNTPSRTPAPSFHPSHSEPGLDPNLSTPSPDASSLELADAFLFIDNLGLQFCLTKDHIFDLRAIYELAVSLPGRLTRAEAMTQVFKLGCQYGTELRILRAIQGSDGSADGGPMTGSSDLKGVMKELSIRLNSSFQLTKEQRTTVRRIGEEEIYKPRRTVFKVLHNDVDRIVRAKPTQYGLDNVFGQSGREEKWTTENKRISSSVRNKFRQELRDSILGDDQISLEKFTSKYASKYRHGNISSSKLQGYLVHNVLLRRFAFEHKDLLVAEPEGPPDAGADGGPGPTKKRKTSASPPAQPQGRKADGTDFWSQVDAWFQEKLAEWGDDFNGVNWKIYIDESIRLDDERYTLFRGAPTGPPGEYGSPSGIAYTPLVQIPGPGPVSAPGLSCPPSSESINALSPSRPGSSLIQSYIQRSQNYRTV